MVVAGEEAVVEEVVAVVEVVEVERPARIDVQPWRRRDLCLACSDQARD